MGDTTGEGSIWHRSWAGLVPIWNSLTCPLIKTMGNCFSHKIDYGLFFEKHLWYNGSDFKESQLRWFSQDSICVLIFSSEKWDSPNLLVMRSKWDHASESTCKTVEPLYIYEGPVPAENSYLYLFPPHRKHQLWVYNNIKNKRCSFDFKDLFFLKIKCMSMSTNVQVED